MLTRLFNSLRLQSLIFSLIACVLVTGAGVLLHRFYDSPLIVPYAEITVPADVYRVLLVLIVPALAFFLNSILSGNGFLKKHFLVVVLFGIQVFTLAFVPGNPSLLLASPLLIVLVYKLMRMVQVTDVLTLVFDAGILIGLVSILLPEAIFLVPVCWLAALIFGHLSLRALFIPVAGVFAVYFAGFSIFFFFTRYSFPDFLVRHFAELSFHINYDLKRLLPLLPVAIALIPAVAEYIKAINFAKAGKRKMLNFMMSILVFSFLAGSFLEDGSLFYFWMAIPISVLLTNLIQYLQKWWMQDLVFLAVLSSFFVVSLSGC